MRRRLERVVSAHGGLSGWAPSGPAPSRRIGRGPCPPSLGCAPPFQEQLSISLDRGLAPVGSNSGMPLRASANPSMRRINLLISTAGRAEGAEGASGAEAAEEGGTSGTNTPREESATIKN